MGDFLLDFSTFVSFCLGFLTQILNWFLSTIPGKISIYIIIIVLIISTIIYIISKFKD